MAISKDHLDRLTAVIKAKKIPEPGFDYEKYVDSINPLKIVDITPATATNPIDPRIRYLSYSSNVTLHKCPRKFQLYKLGQRSEEPEDVLGALTFDFGHAVGGGIQDLLKGCTLQQSVWNMFKNWKSDLLIENPKQKKSFALAVYAVQKFEAALIHGALQDYELVYYEPTVNGITTVIPAVELSFRILFPDGFIYRGHVDAILKHKYSGKIKVLECKTDSNYSIAAAKYKNSSQGISYSVVLDVIEPEASSYEVMYPVYLTKQQEWEILEFPKTHLQRALWIQEVLLDIDRIKAYEEARVYPMHGESCYDFFRDCEYLSTCSLNTQYLVKEYIPELDKELEKEYLFTFTLEDIVSGQLRKQ